MEDHLKSEIPTRKKVKSIICSREKNAMLLAELGSRRAVHAQSLSHF